MILMTVRNFPTEVRNFLTKVRNFPMEMKKSERGKRKSNEREKDRPSWPDVLRKPDGPN